MTAHDTFARTPGALSPAFSAPLHELAENHDPASPEALLLQVIERLSGLSDQMRQTQADRRWAEIPEKVWEVGNNPGATPGALGVTLASPMVGDTVFIERVIVSIPAGATGALQLGNDTIPNLPAGVTSLQLGRILFAVDTRAVTISGASGAVWFALSGYQLAPTGSMAP